MKKNILLMIFLVLLFLIFLYFYFKPKEYERSYFVNEYQVFEKYSGGYYFDISKDDYIFKYYYPINYRTERKLINEIKTYKKNEFYCIYFKIDNTDNYPVCFEKNELIDFHLIEDSDFNKFFESNLSISKNYINKSENNINLYYNYKAAYAIWNYKDIIYIKNDEIKKINVFKNDVIDNSLIAIANRYLFIPNYEQKNSFDQVYIFNLENGNKKIWKFNYQINYESYILGSIDNKIYVVDQKANKEYEFDILNEKINIVSTDDGLAKTYENGWKEITMSKLIASKYTFKKENERFYLVLNDRIKKINLNINTKTTISYINSPKIIYMSKNDIFYIKDDILYLYNQELGEKKVIKYYEWLFNNNTIYIYNP